MVPNVYDLYNIYIKSTRQNTVHINKKYARKILHFLNKRLSFPRYKHYWITSCVKKLGAKRV